MTKQTKQVELPEEVKITNFESILEEYADWLPEKVCYWCEKSEQLTEFPEGDTGWWCPNCESSEVYYVRDSFLDELKECQKGVDEKVADLIAQAQQEAVERERKNKVTLKANGKNLSPRDFAGSFWTEGFRKKGVDEVVIEVDGQPSILLDWNIPIKRYGNEDDRQKWEEYIHQRAQDGWKWCASWNYGMFEALKKEQE